MADRLGALRRLRERAVPRARPPRDALVALHAPGRSFADVGCMWHVDGAIAFAAERAGATRVTGVDLMPASEAFAAEHARRGSSVRFVQGDLHDRATVAEVGVHDVVWCSGVVYHAPHPLLTLQRLRELTGDVLLLASEVLPERRPSRTVVFAPDPGSHPAHTVAFDAGGGYVPWWWGLSPSALRAMTEAAGFTVEEEHATRHHLTLVARAR